MSAPHALLIALTALAATGGLAGAEAARAETVATEQLRDPLSAIDLGGLDTRSAALMLSAQEAGDLAVDVLAIPLPLPDTSPEGIKRNTSPEGIKRNTSPEGIKRNTPAGSASEPSGMTLVVDIGGGSLLEDVPTQATELITEIYAYALDAEGGLLASLTQAVRLELERDRTRLTAAGVKFFGSLELPPGEYSLRVLVLQRSSGRLGLRILPVKAPAWGPHLLLPPVRRESPADWILVQAAGEAPAFPITIDGESWVPSASRNLDAGAHAGYLLLGRGLATSSLTGNLLESSREELTEVGLGDLRPATRGPAGLEALAAELDTTALESGEYRFRVSTTFAATAGGPAGEPTSADSVALLVRQSPRDIPPIDEPAGLSARQSKGREAELERLAELRTGYQRTLDRLASGDRAEALEPMVTIERTRIGTGSIEEQQQLARAQLEVARELSRPDPERLLTALWIHEALYRSYHRNQRFLLATHSRQVVRGLAELYLERANSSQARHLVACALVSLAGYLQQIGSLPAADNAYHDALAYDPNHPAALIGLAAIQESYSQYEQAVILLQRLSKLDPTDTQVRLRLAINLGRQKKARRALELLNEVLSAPGPEWVAAVAAQELAKLHAGDKRLDEAIQVLEEAVVRHGDVQRLKIQLAALLDSAGRRTEALSVLDRLDPSAGSDVSSPRLIYSRAPTAAVNAARRALAEVTDRQLTHRRAARRLLDRSSVAGGGAR